MAQRKRLLVRSSDKWEKWGNYLFQFQNFSLQLNAFTIYNFYALQECNLLPMQPSSLFSISNDYTYTQSE